MDSTTLIIISFGILVVLLGVAFIYLKISMQKMADSLSKNSSNDVMAEWLKSFQSTVDVRLKNVSEELFKSSETLNIRVDRSTKALNERLDHASNIIGNVQKELGSMSEIGRSMKDLQDFLRSPKLRGNIGEQILKELLSQMLPHHSYVLQHTFSNGERVDALLKIEDGFISVDSKFPMENFKASMTADTSELRDSFKKIFLRDVKKHIDDIANKYILPAEGTVDFALMYIPSEAIYYEIVVNNNELGEYSWTKRVLPVSPNLFYSYLKAILIGLEGKKIESRAKEILIAIRGIKQESTKFNENLRVLTKHITNARNTADEVNKSYEKLDTKINQLDGHGQIGVESPQADAIPTIS